MACQKSKILVLDARRTAQQPKSNYIKSNQTNPVQYKQPYLESDQITSNQVILSSIQSKSNQTKQNKIVLGDTPSNRDYLFFWGPHV